MPRRRSDTMREIYAPLSSDPTTPNRIVSVLVRPNERVTWEWSTGPRGGTFVSGFRIARPWRRAVTSAREPRRSR